MVPWCLEPKFRIKQNFFSHREYVDSRHSNDRIPLCLRSNAYFIYKGDLIWKIHHVVHFVVVQLPS